MRKTAKLYAVILAAGVSERLGSNIPKQFIKLAGKSILEHTIEIFERHTQIDEICLVTNPSYKNYVEEILLKNSYNKVTKVLIGGKTRQESTLAGISAISEEECFVLIHDAVRPFLSERIITEVIKSLDQYEAVDVAIPATDTIIRTNKDIILEIPDRSELMLGQTPQGFRFAILKKAYELYKQNPVKVTDDCGLIVKYNLGKVGIVQGDRFNMKVTYPEDLYYADKVFQVKSQSLDGFDNDVLRELEDKVIVIFGGNRGIGKRIFELAKGFGARVYAFSRKNGCDVSDPDSVQKVLKEVYQTEGCINYVVNSAALLRMGTLDSRTYDSITSDIMTNYFGTVVVAKESFPYLAETKGSLLFFTSSSYTRGRSLYCIYSSTKAAIVNIAQALAEEWAPFKCSVNVINPERTNTEMRRENFGLEDPDTLLDPDQVAKVSLLVLLSSFTGQVIDVRRNKMGEVT